MNLTKTYLELRKIANNHRPIQIYELRKRLQNKKKRFSTAWRRKRDIFLADKGLSTDSLMCVASEIMCMLAGGTLLRYRIFRNLCLYGNKV